MCDANNTRSPDKPSVKPKPIYKEISSFEENPMVILRNKNKHAEEPIDKSYHKALNNYKCQSKSLEDVIIKKPIVPKKPLFYQRHFNFFKHFECKNENCDVWPNIKKTIQHIESNSSSDLRNIISNDNIFSTNKDLKEEEKNTDISLDGFTSPKVLLDNYDKAFLVASELLMTEKHYVNQLKLIDQVFYKELKELNKEKKFIENDSLYKIFSYIQSIYTFHKECFLPKLTECIDQWNNVPKLSEVMIFCAPFLKLYTDYVKNFQETNDLINLSIKKSQIFASTLADIERREECNNLSLQHFLLEPIQRVPRYELLLKEYIEKLPLECSEKIKAKEALLLVNKSAQHINDQFLKLEEGKKMLKVSSSIVGMTDLISPHRFLLKEGKVKKVSARDANLVERYLFLFNDILLVCRCLPVKIGFTQQYQLKSKLDISGMMIKCGEYEGLGNCFLVISKQKCIEFHINSSKEMADWLQAICSVIENFTSKGTMKTSNGYTQLSEDEIGKRAPTWVRDQDASMCMICEKSFSVIHRRHHCRGCGKLVCTDCSTHRLRLQYDESNIVRVCKYCSSIVSIKSIDFESLSCNNAKGSNLLKIPANSDNFVLSSWAKISKCGKIWVNQWIALHKSYVLFFYKAKKDISACRSFPLPGFKITLTSQLTICHDSAAIKNEAESDDDNNIISINHNGIKMSLYILIDEPNLRKQWYESLIFSTSAKLSAYIMPMNLESLDEKHVNGETTPIIDKQVNSNSNCNLLMSDQKLISDS